MTFYERYPGLFFPAFELLLRKIGQNWHLNCKGPQTNMPQNVGSIEDLIIKLIYTEFCKGDRTTWKFTLQDINLTSKLNPKQSGVAAEDSCWAIGQNVFTYRKSSIKTPAGAYLFQAHLRQPCSHSSLLPALRFPTELRRAGKREPWERGCIWGGLFNLEKTMVFPERTRIQRGKSQVNAAEDQNQNRTSN